MISEKKSVVILAAVLILFFLPMSGCSEKKSEEKMAEKILELGTGKDVDVKMNNAKIQIKDKDATTEIVETTGWPAELTKDIPEFTAGKIRRVVKTNGSDHLWTISIHIEDFGIEDIRDYEKILKSKGWEISTMQMGEQGGFILGEKETSGINFTYNLEEKSGVLGAYKRQPE